MIGSLFVLPVIVMVALLLFRKNVLMRGFVGEDFTTIFNRILSEMQGRAQGTGATRPGGNCLSRCEALEILGLSDNATPEQITSAYHRLMKFAHPDRGGSEYFAQKLNQARDTLLS
ncbi:DnaJ domain-containing protein [Anaplasma capra]|nr:DnaJ domain-containing protein [Anaplasma capra]